MDFLNCQGAEQTLGGSPSVLCGGMAALHIRFWISGERLPFQTSAALTASDDFTKTEALKSVRGLPVSEASPNFVDNFIQKSRGFNLDNLGRSGVTKFEAITGLDAFSDLAALSASEDFTNVDALKVFTCPNPEQFHGSEAVVASASNRRSPSREAPTRGGFHDDTGRFCAGPPFPSPVPLLRSLALGQRPWRN